MALIAIQHIYQCDVCGKQEEWNANWRHKVYLHRSTLDDETVSVCSEACANVQDARRAKGKARAKFTRPHPAPTLERGNDPLTGEPS